MGKKEKNFYFIHSFGQDDYFSALKIVSGVIGNSSSGIIEVPSFKIGTINIGERQKVGFFLKVLLIVILMQKKLKKILLK